jgi:hypothetical protein
MTIEERNLAWRQRLRREAGLPVPYVAKFQIVKRYGPPYYVKEECCCPRIVDPDLLLADRRKAKS